MRAPVFPTAVKPHYAAFQHINGSEQLLLLRASAMMQRALKGKDESGNAGVSRGHPGEQGPRVQEKGGPRRGEGRERGGWHGRQVYRDISLLGMLGWNNSEQVSSIFWEEEATCFGRAFHLVVLLTNKEFPLEICQSRFAVIGQMHSSGQGASWVWQPHGPDFLP